VYVLASSVQLNSDIVANGCHYFEPGLASLEAKLLPTHHVDRRDGFPFQFFRAQYVVLTNPVGYHLAPENQRVIGLLAEELISGEHLGRSYKRLPFEFALDGGSKAYIYKREGRFDVHDLKAISDTFVRLYPEQVGLFEMTPEMLRELSGF
jgi:hypothetical protein